MTSRGRKILVVEDENVVALDLRSSLSRLGYEVTDSVATGRDAIACAEHNRPDLALMDIRLRGDMDGIEAADHLRRELDVPVVYLTAYSDDETLNRAQMTEPFGYLLKPFDDREIHVTIEMAVFRHRAQKEHEILLREQAERAAIEKEHRWARFLADASSTLSASLDLRSTLDAVPRLVVPYLADRAVLHVKRDDTIEKVGNEEDLPNPKSHLRVMSTGRPDVLAAQICVPLIVRNETFGAITLGMAESKRRYTNEDLEHAIELARRCAISIDNAHLYLRAQDAVALRDEFLSIASHELRTPLSALLLGIHNVERGVRRLGDEPLADKSRRLLHQAERLTDLVDRLLDVSRISAGKLELSRERLELTELVREVAERFNEQAREVGSKIAVRASGPVVGSWDRLRLEQILTNLLGNALKFCERKPIEIEIARESSAATLTVRDQGLGIPKEKVAYIFDRFERGVSARNYGGLGLGLYVTRQLVEAHEGRIRVESELGRGTAFVLELPTDSDPST